jgi:citrate synthase
LRVLNAALIVLADHGMGPATRVARTAAEYRADPHGIIEGALTVLAGGWHGGRSFSAEELIADIVKVGDAATVVGDRFRRQGGVASLGQPRYELGDPRPGIVLRFLRDAVPDHPVHDAYEDLLAVVERRVLPKPAVELGIAAMGVAFEFAPGSTEAIFAISRSVGWLGHAIEAYEAPERESPMFNYVGVRPFGPPPGLESHE